MSSRIVIMSEFYFPDDTATGYYVTGIARGLAQHFRVHAIVGRPRAYRAGGREASMESADGVTIERCPATRLNKDVLLFRLLNIFTLSVSMFAKGLMRLRHSDCVLVVTNPPTLPFLALIACKTRRAKCMLLIHDVYPDALIRVGLLREEGMVARLLQWLNDRLYASVDSITVLGRDMENLVRERLRGRATHLRIIPNWADVDAITPSSRQTNAFLQGLHLEKKFVVQYSGNMGRTHGLETLAEAINRLKPRGEIHFLLIGSGAKKAWLDSTFQKNDLSNALILSPQPREVLSDVLNACDVAVITFVKGMAGVSVPSRMYNIMAAGKPIIAVADAGSEVAMLIREYNIGWIVPPDRPDLLAAAVEEAYSATEELREMGTRARTLAEQNYRYEGVIQAYRSFIAQAGSATADNHARRTTPSRYS